MTSVECTEYTKYYEVNERCLGSIDNYVVSRTVQICYHYQ